MLIVLTAVYSETPESARASTASRADTRAQQLFPVQSTVGMINSITSKVWLLHYNVRKFSSVPPAIKMHWWVPMGACLANAPQGPQGCLLNTRIPKPSALLRQAKPVRSLLSNWYTSARFQSRRRCSKENPFHVVVDIKIAVVAPSAALAILQCERL